jgi:hypothetical protein
MLAHDKHAVKYPIYPRDGYGFPEILIEEIYLWYFFLLSTHNSVVDSPRDAPISSPKLAAISTIPTINRSTIRVIRVLLFIW